MFPNVEVRHLHAVVVLAEEMNFTRAAHRLNVTQPALSKQITELEEQYGLHLFNREKGRLIELTESGQIFVEEASAALSHAERAIQLARATQEGCDRVLTIGHFTGAELLRTSATAKLEDHVVVLRVDVDLAGIPQGSYSLGVRQSGLEWTRFSIKLL